MHFELSSAERLLTDPRLSVFETSLTTPEQAYALVSNPLRSQVFRLGEAAIRKVRPSPEEPLMTLSGIKRGFLTLKADRKGILVRVRMGTPA